MVYLLDSFEKQLSEISLKPSDGGRFEVTVDGNTVFSKLEMDRFPGEEELTETVRTQIGA